VHTVGLRFEGVVQPGYGVGAVVMADPELRARQAHHFQGFVPVPGTLNLLLSEPFDADLFTSRLTSWELGDQAEDHRYAPCRIEGDIPGLVCQTLHPKGREPPELVELIADRHLRTSLKLHDGDRICFGLAQTDPSSRRPLGRMLIAG
jgi:CTP-dependent riboflavin kinase